MADDDAAQTVSISYGFDEAMASRGDEVAVKAVAVQIAPRAIRLAMTLADGTEWGQLSAAGTT